jgi:hypothetical protein
MRLSMKHIAACALLEQTLRDSTRNEFKGSVPHICDADRTATAAQIRLWVTQI